MYRFGIPVTDERGHWRMIIDAEDASKAIALAKWWCEDTSRRVTASDAPVEWVGFIS